MEALPPEMKLLILRLLVAADLSSACQVNKDLFSLEEDDQDCLWRRLFLAVYTNHPAAKRWLCGGVPHVGGYRTSWKAIYLGIPKLRWRAPCS